MLERIGMQFGDEIPAPVGTVDRRDVRMSAQHLHHFRAAIALHRDRHQRADPVALERFCTHFNFEPICFDTADADGRPIYHTNVMMSVATEFAMVGLDLIADRRRRTEIAQRLTETGRAVIALDQSQIANFAGNTLELSGRNGRVLALSRRAFDSLTPDQRATIERSARLLPLDVPTIELAGGSVRCMLAGIHLARRATAPEAIAVESVTSPRETTPQF